MEKNRILQSKMSVILFVVFFYGLIGTAAADTSLYGNWTRVAENVSSVYMKGGYSTAVFNDKMWVIGGQTLRGATVIGTYDGINAYTGGKEDITPEIWSSSDGKTWDLVTADARFSGRISPGVAVFLDRLWVIGGTGLDDVWSSSDGIKWTRETEHTGFSPRGKMGVAVFHDRLWVIAGGNHSPEWEHANMTDDVWSSPDGRIWTRETGHAGFGPRFGYGVVVYKDKLWMIDGLSDHVINGSGWAGGGQDVWFSEDGANWTLVKDNLPFGQREFAPATVFDNKLWIVGGGWLMIHMGHPEVPYYYDNVWSSTDGINWSLEAENVSLGYRPVLAFKNAIWNIGPTMGYMPLHAPESKSSPEHPPTSITLTSSPTISTSIPLNLLTTPKISMVITDVQQSSPSTSSTPIKSGFPTHAGIGPFTVCINLLTALGAVIIIKAIKKI